MLKMANNRPLEAEMGLKEAKTAPNGPTCPQNDPKPRTKVPLCKATLSPCVWAPNSRVSPVASAVWFTTLGRGQGWTIDFGKQQQQQQATAKATAKATATSRSASFNISGMLIA